jgi:hypothetical protein
MDFKEIATCGPAPLAIDFKGIMQMFSCGRATAEVLARESGAEYRIGAKRFYIVSRLTDYVNRIADSNNAE